MEIRKSIRVRLFGGLVILFIILTTALFAQTQSTLTDQNYPATLSDTGVRERLQADWNKRNPNPQNKIMQWYELGGDGFYGTYSSGNKKYMVLYDFKGKYVETLREADWQDNASSALRSSFAMSNYKSQHVTSYWEVSDPAAKKGYYLECTDDQGRISRAWVNEKGDFSITPHKSKSNF